MVTRKEKSLFVGLRVKLETLSKRKAVFRKELRGGKTEEGAR